MKKKMILSEERSKEVVTLTMPADVIRDLERVAEAKGMSDFQSLIRFYVGQELRKDIADLRRKNSVRQAGKILEKYRIDPKIIEEVVAAVA
jgi:hypothetical protein